MPPLVALIFSLFASSGLPRGLPEERGSNRALWEQCCRLAEGEGGVLLGGGQLCLHEALVGVAEEVVYPQKRRLHRAAAVATMREREEVFQPFMHDHRINSSESAPTFAQYTDAMAVSGVWGDHLTLVAISIAYQRPVMVISNQENRNAFLVREGDEEQIDLENISSSVPDNAIVLGYLNISGLEHYVFLRQENR